MTKGSARRFRKSPSLNPDPDPVQVREAVGSLLPGEAAYAQWGSVEGDRTTAFLIRETRERLRSLTQHPRIAIRCVSLAVGDVYPLAVLIRVNDDDAMTYDVWVDYHSPSGLEVLGELVEQKRIFLSFYTATTRRRRLSIYNHAGLKSCALKHIERCRRVSAWSTQQFQHATRSLCEAYPRPMDLWSRNPKE